MNKLLSKLQIEQYENDGYVVPDFKMPEDTIKKIEEMSRAEVKKNKKLIKSKIKNGEDLEEHEQDWADEWNIDF